MNHPWCCCSSVSKPCPTFGNPWTAACQASLSFTISQSLFKFKSLGSVMPANYLILWWDEIFLMPSWEILYSFLGIVDSKYSSYFANQELEYNFPSPTWYIRPGEFDGIHGPHSLENSMDRGAWGHKESHRTEWLTHTVHIHQAQKHPKNSCITHA